MKSLVALPDALSTDFGCFAKMVNEFTVPEELHQNFSFKNESPFCLVVLSKTLLYVPSWISKSQMKDWICYILIHCICIRLTSHSLCSYFLSESYTEFDVCLSDKISKMAERT